MAFSCIILLSCFICNGSILYSFCLCSLMIIVQSSSARSFLGSLPILLPLPTEACKGDVDQGIGGNWGCKEYLRSPNYTEKFRTSGRKTDLKLLHRVCRIFRGHNTSDTI
jgi:hypothetical protein